MAFKSCPHCQQNTATPVRFTPWGGVLGPMLLSLVKCSACGSHFNGKSGRCVKSAIKLYTLTTLLLLITLMALLMYQIAGTKKETPTKSPKGAVVLQHTPAINPLA
jgi:hypothetical protein